MFDLKDKVTLITGGCGLLGIKHAEAILEFGGKVILTDVVSIDEGNKVVDRLERKYNTHSEWITDRVNFEWILKSDFWNLVQSSFLFHIFLYAPVCLVAR